MLTPQFILVPLAAMLAGLGLTHGLEPLNLLQARLRARAPGDLSPVDQEQAPAEIVPLIDAMNGLLAQQAQFSATQRQFVANAAHQLKTPLAGIRTQAELALRERDPKQTEASLQQLVRGTDRATRLVLPPFLDLRPGLAEQGIRVLGLDEIDSDARAFLNEYRKRELDPLLTPVTVDPAHPFPRVINKALCLGLLLRRRRRASCRTQRESAGETPWSSR